MNRKSAELAGIPVFHPLAAEEIAFVNYVKAMTRRANESANAAANAAKCVLFPERIEKVLIQPGLYVICRYM